MYIGRSRFNVGGMVAAGLMMVAVQANALLISYEATDLTDTTPGKDLWRYTYRVSDHTFQANEGFDIYFATSLYANLTNPQPDSGPQWFASSSVGGTPGQPAIFDAITVVANPSLDLAFTVDFEWLGRGTPGDQPFDVYQTANGDLQVYFRGQTTVPDGGSSLMLAGLGVGAVLSPRFLRRRKTSDA